MRGLNLVDNLLQDLRFAVRQLRKSPGVHIHRDLHAGARHVRQRRHLRLRGCRADQAAALSDPSRLVGVYESVAMFPQSNLSYADYLDWKRLNNVFTSLAAYQTGGMTLSTPEGAQRARGARVSDDFFRTLGVTPILGRDFRPGEDLPAAAAHGDAELRHVAETLRRAARRPRTIGDAQRHAERDCRRPAAGISFRSG